MGKLRNNRRTTKKVKREVVTIQDRETVRWLHEEQARRGDGTTARTAMKLIGERRAQLERERAAG